MELAAALDLGDRELVAFVGAGGKKTAMSALATGSTAEGRRVAYTTTTHMPPPAELPLVVAPAVELQARVGQQSPVAFGAKWVDSPDRAASKLRGYEPSMLDDLTDSFDWLLVKADGARRRGFKAPAEHEPAIPARSSVVVVVVSVQVVGEPLSAEVVHRPEQVAALADCEIGTELTPDLIGTVLASPAGGLKGIPGGSRVIAMVNKADSVDQQDTAREILRAAFARSDRFADGLVTSFQEDVCLSVDPLG